MDEQNLTGSTLPVSRILPLFRYACEEISQSLIYQTHAAIGKSQGPDV